MVKIETFIKKYYYLIVNKGLKMSLDDLTANEKPSKKAIKEAKKTQDKIYYSWS